MKQNATHCIDMHYRAGIVGLVLIGLIAGCATGNFTPYQGQQQRWPTAPGAFVSYSADIPVYHGWPNRPYRVLGELRARGAHLEAYAAAAAKRRGAQAVIAGDRSYSTAGFWSTGSTYTQAYSSTGTAVGVGSAVALPLEEEHALFILIRFDEEQPTEPKYERLPEEN